MTDYVKCLFKVQKDPNAEFFTVKLLSDVVCEMQEMVDSGFVVLKAILVWM